MAREIVVLRENDLRKLGALGRVSENALTIYEGLFDKPTVSIEDVIKILDISYASAGRLLDRLVEMGILASLNNRKRKKIFVYRNYMDIFSND